MDNTDLMRNSDNLPSIMNEYAEQGRMYLTSAAMNLVQFGRVLCEAKPMIPHGQFGKWVQDSFGMSQSTADNYMGVYKRFGQREQFSGMKFSVLREMLSLPAGTEESFVQENPVDEMTARAVKEAVAKAKAEAQAEIEAERNARIRAEQAAQKPSDDGIVQEMRKKLEAANADADGLREEVQRQAEMNRELIEQNRTSERNLQMAQSENRELTDMLTEQQDGYNRMQEELLNARSALAKGDAERRVSEEMTSEDFAGAVRSFIGYASQIPLMGAAFAIMSEHERERYAEQLRIVADWLARSQKAVGHVMEVILDA